MTVTTEDWTLTTEEMNDNCDRHEQNMATSVSTETLYVLDLGSYSSNFLVKSQQMSKVISVLEELVKVNLRNVDLQRDYKGNSRYEDVIVKDTKSAISIRSYPKGSLYHMEHDEVEALIEDFRKLRAKNDEEGAS